MDDTGFALSGVTLEGSDQLILNDVNLCLPRGGSLVISGANGAGKSTLLRVLRGSIKPTSGTVTTLGVEHPLPPAKSASVTAVLDEPVFWPWMKASKVLETILNLSGKGLEGDGVDVLAAVGLDADMRRGRRREKRIRAYSQGMRKRLQVACALAMRGELLLVDEPTSNLDVDGAAMIWDALRQKNLEGTTLVVVSHDPGASKALGARNVEMRYGEVVSDQPATSVEA